jgi:hypothetical protein
MARTRKSSYRAQFDGHRRLAAAVILQAIKDMRAAPNSEERATAREFLKGDMWPFSDVLDLPMDGNALRACLRRLRLVPSRAGR